MIKHPQQTQLNSELWHHLLCSQADVVAFSRFARQNVTKAAFTDSLPFKKRRRRQTVSGNFNKNVTTSAEISGPSQVDCTGACCNEVQEQNNNNNMITIKKPRHFTGQ